jgi:hypothetical protein
MKFGKTGYNLVINSRNKKELSVSKQEIMKIGNSSGTILEFP